MRIAIPVWQGRVSPLLDSAERVLVLDFEGKNEVARREETVSDAVLPARAARLGALESDWLICGGVSQTLALLLAARGVHLLPWVTGGVDEVISAFLSGTLEAPRFVMPGCMRSRRRFGRRDWRGFGRGFGGQGGGWTRQGGQ